MDRLKTTDNGGMPFDLDDLRWIEGGIDQAFEGIGSALSDTTDASTSFMLSGATGSIGGGNINIVAGFAYYLGEVVKIDAQSITDDGAGNAYWWTLDVDFDSSGNETFESGSSFDTYQTHRLILNSGASAPAGAFLFDYTDLDSKTFAEALKEFTEDEFGEVTTIDLSTSTDVVQLDAGNNEIALVGPPAAGSFLKYNVVGKMVHIIFKLETIQTTTFSTSNCARIRIKGTLLPFTLKSGVIQEDNYNARCTDTDEAISGVHPALSTGTSSNIELRLMTWDGSFASFNKKFIFTGTTDKTLSATADDSFNTTWTMNGVLTFELN